MNGVPFRPQRITWPEHVTGFRVESQTALQLVSTVSMAVLVGRTSLLQAFRVQAADRDSACRLAAAFSSSARRYLLSGRALPASRLSGHGVATRHYSSEAKDDLRVRYLDGEDDGKSRAQPRAVHVKGGKRLMFKMLRDILFQQMGNVGNVVSVRRPQRTQIKYSPAHCLNEGILLTWRRWWEPPRRGSRLIVVQLTHLQSSVMWSCSILHTVWSMPPSHTLHEMFLHCNIHTWHCHSLVTAQHSTL